jgi:D-alanyl-D-alanine carboxypeptidase (penicillin-binding protein 5/6)
MPLARLSLLVALLAALAIAPPAAAQTKPKPHPKATTTKPKPAPDANVSSGSFDTSATHVFVIDDDTGTVLFDKAGEERIPTASMSKMMTMYVVFEQLKSGKLKLDDELPVSEHAWRTGQKDNESKMWVDLNTKVKVDDLIRGVTVQSGNDACIVLAEGIAGSVDAFVERMNEEAKRIGLNDSHFANVDGLPDPDHYMTARDLATLGSHLIHDFPEYYFYFSEREFTYANIKQQNRNPLLYSDSGADGIKTGHTKEAGFSLTGSVKRNGRRIIAVITGLESNKGRSAEAERIIDYAFRSFEDVAIVKKGESVDDIPVFMGTATKVPLVAARDLAVTLPRAARKDMKVTVSYDAPVQAPVAAGKPVGTLTVTAPGIEAQTVPLVTGAAAEALGPAGHMFAALEYLIWGRGK